MSFEIKTIFLVPAIVLLLGTTVAFLGCDEPAAQNDSVLTGSDDTKVLLFEENKTSVYELSGADGKAGYIVDSEVVSRSGAFQIRVILDNDYIVSEARVTSYPAQKGRQVKFPGFTDQFKGKGLGDAIRLGHDIDAVSGATISSRVMSDGVRDAIRVVYAKIKGDRQ